MDNLKARAEIIINKDAPKRVESTVHELLRLSKPDYWNTNIEGNAEVQNERAFQRMMLITEEHTRKDLRAITVHEFYSLTEYIKEKNKAENG